MTIGLLKLDGFDNWALATGDMAGSGNASSLGWTSAGNGTFALVTGANPLTRSGRGQALRIDPQAATNNREMMFPIVATASGSQHYFGFNAYIGVTSASPTGFHRFFALSNGGVGIAGAGGTYNFTLAATTGGGPRTWRLTGTGGATGGTILATGQPTQDPWQTWCWFEIRFLRDAAAGKVQMWQEKADGTMELVLDLTADTSVTTVGTITKFSLLGSESSGNGTVSAVYDDFMYAASGAPGVPCYVTPLFPASDVQTGGWVSSTGGALWSQLDEYPSVTGTDYIYTTSGGAAGSGAGVGTFPSKFLVGQAALPYTPNAVYGIQALAVGSRGGLTGGSNASPKCVIHKGATDYEGASQSFQATSLNTQSTILSCLELDPDTGVAWSAATANAVSFGVTVTAALGLTGGFDLRIYSAVMYMLASTATAAVAAGGQAGTGFFMICTG